MFCCPCADNGGGYIRIRKRKQSRRQKSASQSQEEEQPDYHDMSFDRINNDAENQLSNFANQFSTWSVAYTNFHLGGAERRRRLRQDLFLCVYFYFCPQIYIDFVSGTLQCFDECHATRHHEDFCTCQDSGVMVSFLKAILEEKSAFLKAEGTLSKPKGPSFQRENKFDK